MSDTLQQQQIISATPVFRVPDVGAAAQYYVDIFGFERKWGWGDPPHYIGIGRDELEIHLVQTDDPEANTERANAAAAGRTDLYIFVRDVDAIYAELMARGADIQREPHTEEYGMRDFNVRDLNGYALCFGQDVSGEDEA